MSRACGTQYLGKCIDDWQYRFVISKPLHRRLLCSLVGHGGGIRALSAVHDTMLVITGAKDCAIIVWNAKDGTRVATLNGHLGLVRCLLPFYLELESGRTLQIASGSMDSTVKVSDRSKSLAVN